MEERTTAMAAIRHQTRGTVRGLWLLDESALTALDSLIDDYEVNTPRKQTAVT